VKDSGIGISEEKISDIFEPFEQGDKNVSKLYGGTGLGLPISRHKVNLFGGDLTVESEIGKGSEFKFEIWLEQAEEEVKAVNTGDPKGKFVDRHLLVVDDVEINRMIVRALLEETGFEISEAEDGSDAVRLFNDSPEGFYDLILMDIQMSTMDGYEAARSIRALDRADAGTVPIVALTANAFKEDVERAKENGMNSHIAKPVEYETLVKELFRYVISK
jgi:CheY-like chemotaxis protein